MDSAWWICVNNTHNRFIEYQIAERIERTFKFTTINICFLIKLAYHKTIYTNFNVLDT